MAFNFDIVLLLVVLATSGALGLISRVFLFLPLFLFLLFLRRPNFIDIEQLNSNNITLESTITVLRTTNVDVSVQDFRGDVCIRTVAFIDTKDTDDELPGGQERR